MLMIALTGCGTQLRSSGSQACAPGTDEWLAQVAAEPVIEVPPDATNAQRSGVVNCPTLPIIGLVGGDPVVELKTTYTSDESEEQVAVRLQNAAGMSDWSSFDGGGACLMKLIEEVPSFLTITSVESTFTVTVRRDDPEMCGSEPEPDPGETPLQ